MCSLIPAITLYFIKINKKIYIYILVLQFEEHELVESYGIVKLAVGKGSDFAKESRVSCL